VGAGVAMLIGAVSRNADQASSLGVFAGLALGALGGCMIPIQVMPEAMQTVARLVPHSWALLGIQAVIHDGGGLASVATNVAVLGAYAAVLLVLAGWQYRKAITGR
jgi:ABC-2 type transport system permease protein